MTDFLLLQFIDDMANVSPPGMKAVLQGMAEVLSPGGDFIVRLGPVMYRFNLEDILISPREIAFLPGHVHLELSRFLRTAVIPHWDPVITETKRTIYGTDRSVITFNFGADQTFGYLLRGEENIKNCLRDAVAQEINDRILMGRTNGIYRNQYQLQRLVFNSQPQQNEGMDNTVCLMEIETGLEEIILTTDRIIVPSLQLSCEWKDIVGCNLKDNMVVAFPDRILLSITPMA